MQKSSKGKGVLALFFALCVALFSGAVVANAAVSDNPLNTVIEKGISDINKKMSQGGSPYATLKWDTGSPHADGGTVVCTITKDNTITNVKTDIVDTLVNYLVDNYETVSSIQCTKTMNGIAPGDAGFLELTKDVSKADVVKFAKACLGNSYQPGKGIVSLCGSSFSVLCDEVSGKDATYTMVFVDKTNSGSVPDTQKGFSGKIANTQSQAVINSSLAGFGTVTPTLPDDNGAVTWDVDFSVASYSAENIGRNVLGNIISSAKDAKATKVTYVPAVSPSSKGALRAEAPSSLDLTSATDDAINTFAMSCLKAVAGKDAGITSGDLNKKSVGLTFSLSGGKEATHNISFSAPEPANVKTVIVSPAQNGNVKVTNENAKSGDTVGVIPIPNTGYIVQKITIKNAKDEVVREFSRNEDNTYTFTMPSDKVLPVTVSVLFEKQTPDLPSPTIVTLASQNGSYNVSDTNAKPNDTVTVFPKANEGYEIDQVVVRDSANNELSVTKNSDGTYSFVVPSARELLPLTVSVSFKEISKQDPTEGLVLVHRLFQPVSGEHLITIDENEVKVLTTKYGWKDETAQNNNFWQPKDKTSKPVYRLYNPSNGDHFYTADKNEYDVNQTKGWKGEGIKFYGATEGKVYPVYRMWNKNMSGNGGSGSHLWTIEKREYDYNESIGWTKEPGNVTWNAAAIQLPLS